MRRIGRRQVIVGGVIAPLTVGCGGGVADTPPPTTDASPDVTPDASASDGDAAADGGTTPLPFRAPGRVVEVHGAGSVVGGVVQASRLPSMFDAGMLALTKKGSVADAWRAFFEPKDVVVIKVNPFGYPKFYSQIATVAELVRGLGLAGVTNDRIIVYDRYTEYLEQVGYLTGLPTGITLGSGISINGDQTDTTNYDLTQFAEFPKVDTGLDASNPTNRRSYLSKVVSETATKVINVPVLKDHWTAGFTAALKNMTYGLVNNTARSHSTDGNWTIDFLPGVASLPRLRDRVVLNVVDLLIGCYDGGPEPSPNTFEHESLMFSTDPVAVDRVAWGILDAVRATKGLPAVATLPDRQPDYVFKCAAAGLGIADLDLIERLSLEA